MRGKMTAAILLVAISALAGCDIAGLSTLMAYFHHVSERTMEKGYRI